jgi:hypothetical protein
VTGIALIAGVDVCGGLASCRNPIMTFDAGACAYGAVIEAGHQPVGGRMTDIALVSRHNMARPFTRRDNTIVATVAYTDDFRMIHCN